MAALVFIMLLIFIYLLPRELLLLDVRWIDYILPYRNHRYPSRLCPDIRELRIEECPIVVQILAESTAIHSLYTQQFTRIILR